MTTNNIQLSDELIFRKIFVMRQHKVMLDSDLAELYDVNTKRLNEQVKRNPERFPQDFMFQLTQEEWSILKSQNATSRWGGRRTLPYVFTEHGVLMLSSVLTSPRAVAVNIRIMRVYVQIREMIQTNSELISRLDHMEDAVAGQDEKILRLFSYMQQFVEEETAPRRKVGYK